MRPLQAHVWGYEPGNIFVLRSGSHHHYDIGEIHCLLHVFGYEFRLGIKPVAVVGIIFYKITPFLLYYIKKIIVRHIRTFQHTYRYAFLA